MCKVDYQAFLYVLRPIYRPSAIRQRDANFQFLKTNKINRQRIKILQGMQTK